MFEKLGKLVKDRVSGFEGIATAETRFLQGCNRILVQPKVKEDGILPDTKYFDEPDIVVIGDGIQHKEANTEKPPGGPREQNSQVDPSRKFGSR